MPDFGIAMIVLFITNFVAFRLYIFLMINILAIKNKIITFITTCLLFILLAVLNQSILEVIFKWQI